MPAGPPLSCDWRDAAGYAALHAAGPDAFAWEWLRRDPLYREAARGAAYSARRDGVLALAGDPAAARWGLHAFEDPTLPAGAARPVWRREHYPRVLVVTAAPEGAADDRFDLARFARLATLVAGTDGAEHLLLAEGLASLRIDSVGGSLAGGPARLAYRLAGFSGLDGPLAALRDLLELLESGRLRAPRTRSRNRRLVLLLRAYDALQAGAGQREIACVLLSPEAARARWRTEAPSLRLRAQRLAGGARAMARGGYGSLLA